jgi:hypothetical protein
MHTERGRALFQGPLCHESISHLQMKLLFADYLRRILIIFPRLWSSTELDFSLSGIGLRQIQKRADFLFVFGTLWRFEICVVATLTFGAICTLVH